MLITMATFRQKTERRSAVLSLRVPFPDIGAFTAFVQNIVLKNPFGCTSYMTGRKTHPPVEKVRYGTPRNSYTSIPAAGRWARGLKSITRSKGYQDGIAAVVSNTANALAHGGKARHVSAADLFAATLQCHDPDDTLWFFSIARDRVTISSYSDDATRKRVEAWAKTVPALQ